jgi:DNA-directed RNA polymerase specialized sigma24 family protein
MMIGVRFALLLPDVMSFPSTRLTLIDRLAEGGSEDDWARFLKDYWGPLCRFCLRHGARGLDDAEDVASQTFEVLWRNRLLARWRSNQSAKLRALLCGVVRRLLANRRRSEERHDRLHNGLIGLVDELSRSSQPEIDVFYAAWVEGLIEQAVATLAVEYCGKGQGDRIRVLCGRLCEGLTIAGVADALNLKPTTVDFYFRDARDRLAETLRQLLEEHVRRYVLPDEAEAECALEWKALGAYLAAHGGLDEAVRQAFALLDAGRTPMDERPKMGETLSRLTSMGRESTDGNGLPETP